jgi:hypothetical protein
MVVGLKKQYLICGSAILTFGLFLIPIVSFIEGFPVCLICLGGGILYLSLLRIIAAPMIIVGFGLIMVAILPEKSLSHRAKEQDATVNSIDRDKA